MRFVIFLALFMGQATAAKEQAPTATNLIRLKNGIELQLPTFPTDPAQIAAFAGLTPSEQHNFYVKRRFIMERLLAGVGQPGLRQGFRWIKNRLFNIMGREIPAPPPIQEMGVEWVQAPEGLSPERKAYVEAAVAGLIENLWQNAPEIARTNGLGITLVAGGIWNTTLPRMGYVFGRGVSIDIGVDFKSETGYLRVMKDAQSLDRPGISLDIGAMFDFLFHVTNSDVPTGDVLGLKHYKLPVIGCFRSGPGYRAWGTQMGVSVFEMAGAWLAATGQPAEGGAMITATRAVGMATVYSTELNRQILHVRHISEPTVRRLGFGKLFEVAKELRLDRQDCDNLLTPGQS